MAVTDKIRFRRKPRRDKAPLNTPVLVTSALVIAAITAWTIIAPKGAGDALAATTTWIATWFGWFYVALAGTIVVFVFWLAFSRYGNMKLGPQNSKPLFSLPTWAAMLFAAGIGTDLMFFSVAEPVTQYLAPPSGEPETIEAARQATVWTLFHYGLTGWAMYALMGIALGFFAYRRGKPLAVRSALYPILGNRVHGLAGDMVDAAAILGTIFGVATTLGIGVVQINVGLQILFGIEVRLAPQILLAAVAVALAGISAWSGVAKGIRVLSQLNVFGALLLAAWVLFTGDTPFLLNAMVMNVGDLVSGFGGMALETFAFTAGTEWMAAWTLFFWAWWIAWASFVGMFLARISRGRTIREFVFGCLILPLVYIVMWVSIFGNSALEKVRSSEAGREWGAATMDSPEFGFYTLLQDYPWPFVVVLLATSVAFLFYVTSADSGALVMANLSSRLPDAETDGRTSVKLLWAVLTGALTIGVLIVGGIPALQNATIVMGLPFAFVIVGVMVSMVKALREETVTEKSRERSARNVPTGGPATLTWRERVAWTFGEVTPWQAVRFLNDVAQPALEKLAAEIPGGALVERGDDDPIPDLAEDRHVYDRLKFTVRTGSDDFVYRILAVAVPKPVYGVHVATEEDYYTRLEVHTDEQAQDYDVMGYTVEGLIHDVLDHLDRHQDYLRLRDDSMRKSAIKEATKEAKREERREAWAGRKEAFVERIERFEERRKERKEREKGE
ncbi:choline/glycine/proline betaine transport protein [Arcanobacterium wilhelmae]|uniref:Choline/glycine/proline betaine transport protein n=1 Tax=Arcanobacterium wilhelmae TaxID=1803177 RepID=A0ABT9N9P4_9ACTO|nr:choline BCCT transporter BetT [Arcanobacterium wilhelmae]MDP9800442.1 choline/glycine/proline betaine transport protein [Arcanobacterium wilhelmae]